MKKLALSFLASLVSLLVFAQNNDKIIRHNGQTLEVKVIKVGESTITFKYPGEDAEQTLGKLAIASITYGSGRKEEISNKIDVGGKEDWEKVQIVTDPALVLGLKAGDDVRGKTSGMFSYQTAGSADKKATRKLKEAAAAAGAPYILLTAEKSDNFGVKQSIKNGVAYTYK